jgi:hypothetical protein
MGLIDSAIAKSDAREPKRIDYDRMKRTMPKHKAALTRAKNTGDPEKVAAACVKAMNEWDAIGAWPDNWSLWQRTLDDVLPWNRQVDLRDLPR